MRNSCQIIPYLVIILDHILQCEKTDPLHIEDTLQVGSYIVQDGHSRCFQTPVDTKSFDVDGRLRTIECLPCTSAPFEIN